MMSFIQITKDVVCLDNLRGYLLKRKLKLNVIVLNTDIYHFNLALFLGNLTNKHKRLNHYET